MYLHVNQKSDDDEDGSTFWGLFWKGKKKTCLIIWSHTRVALKKKKCACPAHYEWSLIWAFSFNALKQFFLIK